jgi:hypothetical protein
MRMVTGEGDAAVVEGVRRADAPPAGPQGGGTVWFATLGAGADVVPRVRTVGYRRPRRLDECDSMTLRRTARPRRSHRQTANDWTARGRVVSPESLTRQKAPNGLYHRDRRTTIDKL